MEKESRRTGRIARAKTKHQRRELKLRGISRKTMASSNLLKTETLAGMTKPLGKVKRSLLQSSLPTRWMSMSRHQSPRSRHQIQNLKQKLCRDHQPTAHPSRVSHQLQNSCYWSQPDLGHGPSRLGPLHLPDCRRHRLTSPPTPSRSPWRLLPAMAVCQGLGV